VGDERGLKWCPGCPASARSFRITEVSERSVSFCHITLHACSLNLTDLSPFIHCHSSPTIHLTIQPRYSSTVIYHSYLPHSFTLLFYIHQPPIFYQSSNLTSVIDAYWWFKSVHSEPIQTSKRFLPARLQSRPGWYKNHSLALPLCFFFICCFISSPFPCLHIFGFEQVRCLCFYLPSICR
jgi:hypothetical protein